MQREEDPLSLNKEEITKHDAIKRGTNTNSPFRVSLMSSINVAPPIKVAAAKMTFKRKLL